MSQFLDDAITIQPLEIVASDSDDASVDDAGLVIGGKIKNKAPRMIWQTILPRNPTRQVASCKPVEVKPSQEPDRQVRALPEID